MKLRPFLFLSLLLLFRSSVFACDDGSATLTSVTDNGDGTYDVVYDICVEYYGLEGNPYGWTFNYNNPNSIAVLSFSPANMTSGDGDTHVGGIADGNCDTQGDNVYGACDATDNLLQYYYGGLFPGNAGSPTLCATVSMTIQGYPTSVDFVANADQTTYSSCTKTIVFPPLPLCDITNLGLGAQSPCSPGTNTYSQEIIVTYSNPPASGNLEVNGQVFPITASPQSVTLVDLPADGNPVNVSAQFSDQTSCNLTQNSMYTAPVICGCGANAGTISN